MGIRSHSLLYDIIRVSIPFTLASTTWAQPPPSVTYYGERFDGDQIIWCLDKSDRWGGNDEIEGMKAETRRAILDLSRDQRFGVVAYDCITWRWSAFPRLANSINKLEASAWVDGLGASGSDCLEDGLISALDMFLVDQTRKAILLVADSLPICNGVNTASQVIDNVTAWNYQAVSIHSLYLGTDAEGIEFFENLSGANHGRFILVNPPPPQPVEFRRGDADGNGRVSGLVDGIFVLSYQFVPGSPAPPCLDSADANDSGVVSGLEDGVFLLGFHFTPGSPPPPAPGPLVCGEDPTIDLLSCVTPPLCP